MFRIIRTKAVPSDVSTRVHEGEPQAKMMVGGRSVWVKLNSKGRAVIPSNCWYAVVAGTRVKLSPDKTVALIKLGELKKHAIRVDAGMALPKAETSRPLSSLVTEYVQSMRLSGCKPITYERVPSVLGKLHVALDVTGLLDLRAIRREHLDKWVGTSTLSPQNIQSHLRRFAAWMNWLHSRRHIGLVPEVPKIRGTSVSAKAVLTREHEKQLLSTTPFRRQVLYRLALATGLRAGSAVALRVADLALDRESGPAMNLRAETMKAGKGLMVPVPKILVADLKTLIAGKAPTDLVFGIRSSNVLSTMFRQDLVRSKLDRDQPDGRICLHGLRHTFATRALRAGIPVAQVARIGAWSSLAVLMKNYAHLVSDDVAGVVDKLAEG